MSLKPKQYPYPILSYFNDDYSEDSLFYVEPKITRTTSSYVINVHFILHDSSIEKLIDGNKAMLVMYVACSKTLYRRAFVSMESVCEFVLPKSEIDGKIEYQFSVVAKEDIKNFSSKSFNDVFGEMSFDISKGEPLAIAEPFVQNTNSEDIENKVPSIFNVVKKEKAEPGYFNYTLHSEKIVIELGKSEFQRFNNLRSICPSVLSSIVIVPVLTSVIELLRELTSFEEYEEKRWFLVLEHKLRSECKIDLKLNQGFNDEKKSVYYATKLISGSLNESLSKLEADYLGGD